jgi:hypothetical protein
MLAETDRNKKKEHKKRNRRKNADSKQTLLKCANRLQEAAVSGSS